MNLKGASGMVCAGAIVAAAMAMGFAAEPPKELGANEAAKATPLDRFKALEGTWETDDADKDGKPDMTLVYRTVSVGSAVMENLFPGTDHEMISMFYMDGDNLMCTHYCAMGNQPVLKETKSEGDTVVFDIVGGTNLVLGKGAYMGHFEYTFVGHDDLKTVWKSIVDGKMTDDHLGLTLHRAKKAAAAR